jgi:TonB family protein
VRERTRNGPEAVAPDMGFNIHVGSEGIPTEVDIVKSSGNRDVDKAARAWVYGFRYNAANCVRRTGYLPLVL